MVDYLGLEGLFDTENNDNIVLSSQINTNQTREMSAEGGSGTVATGLAGLKATLLDVSREEQTLIEEDRVVSETLAVVPKGSDSSVSYKKAREWIAAAVGKEGFRSDDEIRLTMLVLMDTFFTVQPSFQLRKLATPIRVGGKDLTFKWLLEPEKRKLLDIPSDVTLRMILRSLSPVAGPRWAKSDHATRAATAVPDWIDPAHIPIQDVARREHFRIPESPAVVGDQRAAEETLSLTTGVRSGKGSY